MIPFGSSSRVETEKESRLSLRIEGCPCGQPGHAYCFPSPPFLTSIIDPIWWRAERGKCVFVCRSCVASVAQLSLWSICCGCVAAKISLPNLSVQDLGTLPLTVNSGRQWRLLHSRTLSEVEGRKAHWSLKSQQCFKVLQFKGYQQCVPRVVVCTNNCTTNKLTKPIPVRAYRRVKPSLRSLCVITFCQANLCLPLPLPILSGI